MKRTPLATYIYEVNHERTVERGYEIAQKKPGNDYTSANLVRIKKEQKAS